MGIWDNVSSMLGKGADAAGRFANATNLKFKLGEEQRKRRDLAAELGESLYETVAANPSWRPVASEFSPIWRHATPR